MAYSGAQKLAKAKNLYRVDITYLTLAVPYLERIVRRVGPNNEQAYQLSPFQIVVVNSCLSCGAIIWSAMAQEWPTASHEHMLAAANDVACFVTPHSSRDGPG